MTKYGFWERELDYFIQGTKIAFFALACCIPFISILLLMAIAFSGLELTDLRPIGWWVLFSNIILLLIRFIGKDIEEEFK